MVITFHSFLLHLLFCLLEVIHENTLRDFKVPCLGPTLRFAVTGLGLGLAGCAFRAPGVRGGAASGCCWQGGSVRGGQEEEAGMSARTGGGRAWEGKPPALTHPPKSSAAASSLPMWLEAGSSLPQAHHLCLLQAAQSRVLGRV